MTRGEFGEQQSSEEERREALQKNIDTATSDLLYWANTEDSSDRILQNFRPRDYDEASYLLERALNDAEEIDQRLSLALPEDDQSYEMYTFRTNPYDFVELRYLKTIEPGMAIDFRSHTTFDNGSDDSETYIGDYGHYLKLSDVARIIRAGGAITVSEKSQEEE